MQMRHLYEENVGMANVSVASSVQTILNYDNILTLFKPTCVLINAMR